MGRPVKLIVAVLFCSVSGLMAGAVLQPTLAPDWEISEWLNEDPGSLRDHRGRVVLIEFFQLWCPGCKSFSTPLFRRWEGLYADREDVLIVSVHSVFEGRAYQTPERLREFIVENGILHPVGVDAHDIADDDIPVTMHRYQTGGTPHLAIVDKAGMLRFTHFGIFDPVPIEAFIERLLDERPGSFDRASETLPVEQRSSRPALDARLSGMYTFRTDRATGVCARWISSKEAPGKLKVYGSTIDVEFEQPFLGMVGLKARYDPHTGSFEGAPELAAAASGRTSAQGLRLVGTLDGQVNPPELEFELSWLDGKCNIQGRASRSGLGVQGNGVQGNGDRSIF